MTASLDLEAELEHLVEPVSSTGLQMIPDRIMRGPSGRIGRIGLSTFWLQDAHTVRSTA